MKGIAIAVVLVVAVGAGWWFFTAKKKAAALSTGIMVSRVERDNLEVTVSGTGAIESAAEEEVRARTSGTITTYAMKDGQEVKAGQVLATLDLEDITTQIKKARLDVEIQERELAELQRQKTRDTVLASASGEVQWEISEGDQVQKGNVIATIQDTSKVEITGLFNIEQVKKIKVGQKAEVLVLDFLSTLPAKVIDVNTASKSGGDGSILYEVKAEIDNPGSLAAGMKGQLTVSTPSGDQRAVDDCDISLASSVDVRAPIAGEAGRFLVDSGKTVSKGQALTEITDQDTADDLVEKIATSQLKLEQAYLELKDLEKKLADSQITAPIDGTLVLSGSEGVGDDISNGTVLATVIDYSRMQVVVPVDELDVEKVKVGQEVKISAEALPEQELSGSVTKIASQGVSESGVATFDVTVSIQSAEGLKVGMTVNADIIVDYRENTLLVPIEAVQQQGGKSFVLVAGAKGSDGKTSQAQRIEVKTGAYDSSRMEILEGLEEGQQIIIEGTSATTSARQPGFMMGGGGPPPGAGGQGGTNRNRSNQN